MSNNTISPRSSKTKHGYFDLEYYYYRQDEVCDICPDRPTTKTTTAECVTRIWSNHPNQGTSTTISNSTTSTTVPKTRFEEKQRRWPSFLSADQRARTQTTRDFPRIIRLWLTGIIIWTQLLSSTRLIWHHGSVKPPSLFLFLIFCI